MTQIWSPTNLAWTINRILVKGPADVANVNAIQDKIIVKPHPTVNASLSKEVPIGFQPLLLCWLTHTTTRNKFFRIL